MGRQAAQPAEGLHDGDNGIGVDDLKGDAAVGLIVAGCIISKYFLYSLKSIIGRRFLSLGDIVPPRENEAPGFCDERRNQFVTHYAHNCLFSTIWRLAEASNTGDFQGI